MAWQPEMTVIIRHLVNDLNVLLFSDSRLEECILVNAQLIQHELTFDNTYTVDVDALTLSPDPTTLAVKDDSFINLVCMKTACLLLTSLAQEKSLQAIRITDGPASIDTSSVYKAAQEMAKDMCDKFSKAKLNYQINGIKPGLAITTPTTNEQSYYSYGF